MHIYSVLIIIISIFMDVQVKITIENCLCGNSLNYKFGPVKAYACSVVTFADCACRQMFGGGGNSTPTL